MLFWFLNF